MRYREIELVEEILSRLRPTSCLEWGTGYSTLFFPHKLSPEAHWLSVDHDEEWTQKIQGLRPNPVVDIRCVPANQFPWTDEIQDGAYSDLVDYIDYPENFAPYDFILVDGRARNYCLQKAFDLIQPRGVVLLHDANRGYYHTGLEQYRFQVFFECYRTHAGGIWLGSREMPIENIVDVDFHQTVWRLCRFAGKVFRC